MDKKNYGKTFLVCLFGGAVWGYLFYKMMGSISGYTPLFAKLCVLGGLSFAVLIYIAILIMARRKKLFSFEGKSAQKNLLKHERQFGLKEESRIFGTMEYKMLLPQVLCEAILYLGENKLHIAFRYFETVYGKEIFFGELDKVTIVNKTVSLKLKEKAKCFVVNIKDGEKATFLKTKLIEKGICVEDNA